jgi:hypothetical protein
MPDPAGCGCTLVQEEPRETPAAIRPPKLGVVIGSDSYIIERGEEAAARQLPFLRRLLGTSPVNRPEGPDGN